MRRPVPFGKYLLLDRVSVGGMAEVFKAKSFGVEGFEKVIAIKRILPSMGEDKDFIDMFIDEAKIAGQLAHANICQIFELDRIEGCHFIAMEYIWGKDLLQIQNRYRKLRQRMPIAMACFVIAKTCEGLDYAHRKRDPLGQPLNIVHRDCSPQNVLVSYEGEVKLIDFGIAKAASRSSRTVAGVLKGKFGYMSPEQVRGLPLDRRSDIFAVGTMLYECLTGERLFQCESDFSTLEKVRNVSIHPPTHYNKDVPPELERIVMRALTRDPEDRYQYAADMQADLQKFLMAQETVFTAKSLGTWLKDSFAAELARERKLMEEYKRIGADGTPRPPRPGSVDDLEPPTLLKRSRSQEIAAPPSPPSLPRARKASSQGDFDDGPTEIFGELSTDVGDTGTGEVLVTQKPAAPPQVRPINEEPTAAKVLVTESGKYPRPRTGDPAAPIGAPAPSAPISFGGRRAPSSPADLAASMSQPLGKMDEFSFGSTSSVPALDQPRTGVRRTDRSRTFKDIGIGLGIAAVALLLFATAKHLFFSDATGEAAAEAREATGTIAVTVPDLEPAEVLINGERVGTIERGQALTRDGLPEGEYAVIVRRKHHADCVKSVELGPRKVEVVSCVFEAPRPSELTLTELDGDATVLVDAQQVSAEAAREPLMLVPNVEHEIIVRRDGKPDVTFKVMPKPGDRLTRSAAAPEAVADAAPKRPVRRARPKPTPAERAGDPPPKDGRVVPTPPVLPPPPDRGSDTATDDDPSMGYLIAWTTPWAKVFIDGVDTGKMTPIAPRAKIPLTPGKHKVTFVVDDQSFSYQVVIEAGKTNKLRKDLPVASKP